MWDTHFNKASPKSPKKMGTFIPLGLFMFLALGFCH